MSSINPILYSVGIYFASNELYVSNIFIRHTLYNKIEEQKYLLYFHKLVENSIGVTSWHIDHHFSEVFAKSTVNYPVPQSVIHMVRKIQGTGLLDGPYSEGAIIISLDEKIFYNIIKKTAAQGFDKIIICDSMGDIISHTDKELLGKNIAGLDYGKKIFKDTDREGYFIHNINGISCVVSYSPSEYNDWIYISITPAGKYNISTGLLLRIIALVAIASVIIGLLLSLISALKLSNPIKTLVNFCKDIYKKPLFGSESDCNIIRSTIETLTFDLKEQERKFTVILPVLRDNFLQDIISKYHDDINRIKERMQLLGLEFPHKYFCVLALHIGKKGKSENTRLYEYKKIDIADAIHNLLDTRTSVCYRCEKDGNIVLIVNHTSGIEKVLETVNRFLLQANGHSSRLYIGVGIPAEKLDRICESYTTAVKSLKYHYIYPEQHIFTANESLKWENNKHKQMDKSLLNAFRDSLQKHDRNGALQAFDSIISSIRSEKYSYDTVMKILSDCISIVEKTASCKGLDLSIDNTDIANINHFMDRLTGSIISIFNHIESLRSELNSEMVQKAIEIIRNNIGNCQLSLQFVANALYISPSHLSRIFKNETGTSFSEFVSAQRLNHSIDLLINTNLKIEEISSMMGYSTPQYYISRFKIKYGYTPKEYRLRYMSSN
ncbi:MAG: AraC family transcriptional regulator [Clostridiaceae bacterium]|nr:AraC family transcriptional regulator [Clostridiaceae bacterium]